MNDLETRDRPLSGAQILAKLNGQAAPLTWTNPQLINAGTLIAATPAMDVAVTWNNAGVTFTGIRLNVTSTASAAGSLLQDLQVASVSKWKVDKSGNATAVGTITGSQLISTVAIGTAPLVVTSTTVVANLNASLLLGATWAAPGTIGSGTPSTGAFTSLTTTLRGAVAAALSSLAILTVGDSSTTNPLTGTNQQGVRGDITVTSACTAFGFGFVAQGRTAAASFTCALAGGAYNAFAQLGAGSTVTRAAGTVTEAPTQGTNNAGLCIIASGGSPAWTGNFAIRSESTLASQFAGSVLSSHATAGIGYAAGAGGTVTQATSKATGVTLNTVAGTITMNAAALASATSVTFVWTNSAIAATDFVEVNHDSVGTLGGYGITVTPAAGSATITVRNNTAGSLSEAIVLRFFVSKSVTS